MGLQARVRGSYPITTLSRNAAAPRTASRGAWWPRPRNLLGSRQVTLGEGHRETGKKYRLERGAVVCLQSFTDVSNNS